MRKIVADMLGIADRLIGDAQFLFEKAPDRLKDVADGKLRLHVAVAPLRSEARKRRRSGAGALKKAARLLRQAAGVLTGEYAELAKQVEAVAARVERERPPAGVAKRPAKTRKSGK